MFERHGCAPKWLHRRWSDMRRRCRDASRSDYVYYGGRGIMVCDEWNSSFIPFRDWSFANGALPELELERIHNDGNYCPENCYWTTRLQQTRNKRNNNVVLHNGIARCLSELAEEYGLHWVTLKARISAGWDIERALMEPVAKGNNVLYVVVNGVEDTLLATCIRYGKNYHTVRGQMRRGMPLNEIFENGVIDDFAFLDFDF